jgi:hypothetical protein
VITAENILNFERSPLCPGKTIEETHHFSSSYVGASTRMSTRDVPNDVRVKTFL